MLILGLDIGSSSVKAGLLKSGSLRGRIVRQGFATAYDGVRAELNPDAILRAIAAAIRDLGSRVKSVDAIALSTMAPSWIAMDKRGRAITPLVTHQDRRSVQIARDIEARVGKARHLSLVGNRPCPGGISSTTWAWFNQHERSLMRRADLVGHLNAFLHRQITSARITDPSNASIMGLFDLKRWGWSDEVLDAIGGSEHQLPQIVGADGIGGLVTHAAGRRFGLTHGTPMLAGMIDTGGAIMLAGAKTGQLINVSGSTDVLALCVDRPRPHERLITRALGVGRTWLSVSTIAAVGSTFNWLRSRLFSDLSDAGFKKLIRQLAAKPIESCVRFEPYLAGERTSVEQRQGAFTGLTLATTREQMLSSAIESIAVASAERIDLLKSRGVRMSRRVLVTGGVSEGMGDVLYRNWTGKWSFRHEEEASLRGLALLTPD